MSKKIWMGLALAAAAAVALSLIALPKEAEWTTDSPEARAEFSAAIEAMMKLYHSDVQAHLERAVELDPDFVMAKLFLSDQVRYDDEERAQRLFDEVVAADLSKLTPREVFYVERERAYLEKRYDDAARMIDQYLAERPDDPFVLHEKALEKWKAGEFEEAERLNRRLIEIAPNWVLAYNQLGYIAMSQGRFIEAEEYFTSYRFVAPDQANPHDSLGELYIILGRLEEAEVSLRQSIEINPAFWAAYDHLAMARTQMGDIAGAQAVHAEARTAGDFPEYWDVGIGCMNSIASLAESEQWPEIVDFLGKNPECLKGHSSGYARVMMHQAACRLGDLETAVAIEDKVEESFEAAEEVQKPERFEIFGLLSHLEGIRFAVEGDLDGAIDRLWKADENMTYIQAGNGLFKLYNRLCLVETLFAAGQDGKAHKVLSKVRSVNPRMTGEFEEDGFKILGLER